MYKNKLLIKTSGILSIVFVVLIASALIINFFSQQITKISKNIQDEKTTDYIVQNHESINSKIKNEFFKVGDNYETQILASLPNIDNVLPFVDATESIAKKNNVTQTLNFINPAATTNTDPLNISGITFTLTIANANVVTLANYLNDFEKLPYFAGITSLSIVSQNTNGWSDNSTINLSGKIYVK